MSWSRERRRQRALYRWAGLGVAVLLTLGLAFPLDLLLARPNAFSRWVLTSQNCRAAFRQALPLLGVHLESGGVPPAPTDGEAGDSDGIVALGFRLITGVWPQDPASFLSAGLPLARSSYAVDIIAAGRDGATPASGPTASTGGGGYPAAGGGLEPGEPPLTGGTGSPSAGSGESAGSAGPTGPPGSAGSAGPTGSEGSAASGPSAGPAEARLEDRGAQLYLYGRGEPVIAIVHTHTSESFLPAVEALARAKGSGGSASGKPLEAFTTDSSANMLRVGEELARYLAGAHGIAVVQSRRVHDAQVDGFRLGAYERSLETMTEILRRHPSVKILLDLHRDSPSHDRTTAVINGVPTATICVIVGTDKLLPNPNWKANYDFARRLVSTMEQNFRGLSRGILVQDERYNQHVMERTLLLEVGGQENTLEEEFAAVHDLGDVLAQIVAEGF